MSVVTCIIGWIEVDGYQKAHNDKVLKELEYNEDFIKMFCSPEETGTKNPDYILFGVSTDNCIFESWLDRFEAFIKKLKAFGVFVFVETESGGDRTFAIGYDVEDGKFIKHEIDFGDPCDYMLESEDGEVDFNVPTVFGILKILQTRQLKRHVWEGSRTTYPKYVACEKCGITLTVKQEGKDNCDQCGSPYINLNNYIVTVEHKDFSQEFAVVPGKTPEDALKRLATDSPGVIRDLRRGFIGCMNAEFGELDVGLHGSIKEV